MLNIYSKICCCCKAKSEAAPQPTTIPPAQPKVAKPIANPIDRLVVENTIRTGTDMINRDMVMERPDVFQLDQLLAQPSKAMFFVKLNGKIIGWSWDNHLRFATFDQFRRQMIRDMEGICRNRINIAQQNGELVDLSELEMNIIFKGNNGVRCFHSRRNYSTANRDFNAGRHVDNGEIPGNLVNTIIQRCQGNAENHNIQHHIIHFLLADHHLPEVFPDRNQ